MESFQWNEGFLTGIADVDDQHRHLVDVINKFGDLISQGKGASRDEVDTVFKELADYTHLHFT
ncbi:MAG: hypothetical protein QGI17_15520, partial [Arenicellales bacterium]|nr:hypothetical protein [Arenicellales bacterium]